MPDESRHGLGCAIGVGLGRPIDVVMTVEKRCSIMTWPDPFVTSTGAPPQLTPRTGSGCGEDVECFELPQGLQRCWSADPETILDHARVQNRLLQRKLHRLVGDATGRRPYRRPCIARVDR